MHLHFHGYFERVQQEMPQSKQEHTNLIRTFLCPSLSIYLSLTAAATSLCPLFLNFENTALRTTSRERTTSTHRCGWEIILLFFLKEGRRGLHSAGSGYGPVFCSCEHRKFPVS
jgi:hypothetical protein